MIKKKTVSYDIKTNIKPVDECFRIAKFRFLIFDGLDQVFLQQVDFLVFTRFSTTPLTCQLSGFFFRQDFNVTIIVC